MALAPLATPADLALKGVDTSANPDLVAMMLDVASSVIRDAAGSTISRATSTVSVLAPQGRWLALPHPVISVATVLVDGVAVTDWKFVGGLLWRACGWSDNGEPVNVTVTFTHGFAEVPADVVNLCADLAKLGIDAAVEGSLLSLPAGVVSASFAIDDHTERVEFAENAGSLMELPTATREWLASRFGGGVYVTGEQQ